MQTFVPGRLKNGPIFVDGRGNPLPNLFVAALNNVNAGFSELAVDINAMRADLAELKLLIDRLEQRVKPNDISAALRRPLA